MTAPAPERPNYRARLMNAFGALGMKTAASMLDGVIDAVASGESNFAEALSGMMEAEVAARNATAVKICVQTARLPFAKRLEDFDFSFQPSLPKEEVLSLRYLGFVETATNVAFVGSPGVGKTHLACALALCAAKAKKPTYFVTCSELMMRLKKAQADGTMEAKLRQLDRYAVLVVDEVGFLPMDADSASLFFQLISRRYEKRSTIITTNKPFGKWAETFGDPVMTNAILDRLLHHCKVFKIVGRSYRTKDVDFGAAEPLGVHIDKEKNSERKED